MKMKVAITEKDSCTFYGIANETTLNSNFKEYWEKFYEQVPTDDKAPIGFSTPITSNGTLTYYTCIQYKPSDFEMFTQVELPAGDYAIFELSGPVTKTIPKAWNFAKKNFVISNSPNIEIYSVGNRLEKNYRMDLWIPIDEVLPSFEKNTRIFEKLKRGVSDFVETTREFAKTDTDKAIITIGSLVLTAGATAILTALTNDEVDSPDIDSEVNSSMRLEDITKSQYDVLDEEETSVPGSHDYPEERKSPKVHISHRGSTYYLRGGTDEEKQQFREENNLDF